MPAGQSSPLGSSLSPSLFRHRGRTQLRATDSISAVPPVCSRFNQRRSQSSPARPRTRLSNRCRSWSPKRRQRSCGLKIQKPEVSSSSEIEGLLMPVGPHDPQKSVSPTLWGDLRTSSSGTPYRFFTANRGPYWVSALVSPKKTATPFVMDGRPHIAILYPAIASAEAMRASQTGGLVVSAWTQLDDSQTANRAVAMDPSAVLDDAAQRWQQHLKNVDERLRQTLAQAPRGRRSTRTSTQSRFVPTWDPAAQRLVVRYLHRATRATPKWIRTTSCPRNRPGPCKNTLKRIWHAYHADFGLELEYDRAGTLRAERIYPPHLVADP